MRVWWNHTRDGACVALCMIESNDDLLEFACLMIKLRKKQLDIVLAEEWIVRCKKYSMEGYNVEDEYTNQIVSKLICRKYFS